MKNILERINNLLKDNPLSLIDFKSILTGEFNNQELVEITIKHGQKTGNIVIEDDTIRLLIPFEINKNRSTADVCLSFPQFEKMAWKNILEMRGINFLTIENAFINLINKSKRSIKICSPFIQEDGWKRLNKYLVEFAKRGGIIKIICRGINEDLKRKKEIHTIINDFEKMGLGSNLDFREYHFKKNNIESSIHAKLFISDSGEAYIGSGEIRKNSFDINFEMGTIVRGDVFNEIDQIFNLIFDSAIKLK